MVVRGKFNNAVQIINLAVINNTVKICNFNGIIFKREITILDNDLTGNSFIKARNKALKPRTQLRAMELLESAHEALDAYERG